MKIFRLFAWVCFDFSFLGILIFLGTGHDIFLLGIVSFVVTGLFIIILQLFLDIRDALRDNINVIINDPPIVYENIDVKQTNSTRAIEEIEADIARIKKIQ